MKNVIIENGAIVAHFSVSPTEKVYFSKGNLQYQASTGIWRFAEQQYDMIGDGNENISPTYNGWIDLFGWGTSGYNSKYPYMTSLERSDYGDGRIFIAGTNYDWGVYNAISNGGNAAGLWRILTPDEWNYLWCRRINANLLKCTATVNNVAGLILLPDNWTTPDSITLEEGIIGFNTNIYTQEQWSEMEANGAVFLPTAGYRGGTSIYSVGECGSYWTSSAGRIDNAYYLTFIGGDAGVLTCNRGQGRSVRLVHDL